MSQGPDNFMVDEGPPPMAPAPPMPSNMALLRFSVAIVDKDSGLLIHLPINKLQQEANEDEVAERITVGVADVLTDRGPTWEMCGMGTPAYLLAGVDKLEEVQRGTIIEVGDRETNAGSFDITIYDPLYNALRDKRDMVFKEGLTITDVLGQYAAVCGFELGTIYDSGTKLPAMVVRQKSVIDGLADVMKLLVARGGPMLKLRSRKSKMECVQPGTNDTVYHLLTGTNQMRFRIKGSIKDFIQKVVVLGHGPDDEALPIKKTFEGLTEYAGAQELVYAEETDSDATVELQAKAILADKGFPVWEYSTEAFINPWITKWDRVRITDNIFAGYFIVSSATLDYTGRTMSLRLVSQEQLDRKTQQIKYEDALDKLKADTKASDTAGSSGKDHGAVVKHALGNIAWTAGGTHGDNDCTRSGKVTPAVDIFANLNEPILAPVAGTMVALTAPLGGNCGILTGDDGRYYYFAHCARGMASGKVTKGQTIGNVGQSGNAAATQPHVHFAIASSSDIFGTCNGSGDIQGDNSYWSVGAG